ncbi:hypothetical protein [Acrocarpospora sp. B8E8]|uniref:hypothetical protein n=1 Tax=Acrocarpospora sp. B8E8 TaxID=3153572 RepID=UPI00325EEB80
MVTGIRAEVKPGLWVQITAITDKAEAFHGFADWLMSVASSSSATTTPTTRNEW